MMKMHHMMKNAHRRMMGQTPDENTGMMHKKKKKHKKKKHKKHHGMGMMGGPGPGRMMGGMGGGPGGPGGPGRMMMGMMMHHESSSGSGAPMMMMKKKKMMKMKMKMKHKMMKMMMMGMMMNMPSSQQSSGSESFNSSLGSSQSGNGAGSSFGVSSGSSSIVIEGSSVGSSSSSISASLSGSAVGSLGSAGSAGSAGNLNPDAIPSPSNPSGFSSHPGPSPSSSVGSPSQAGSPFSGVPEPTPTPSPSPLSQSPFFSSSSTPAPTSSPSSTSPPVSPSSSSSIEEFCHDSFCQNDGNCGFGVFGFINCCNADINGTTGCLINQPSDVNCTGGAGTRAYTRGLADFTGGPLIVVWYTYSCYDVCTSCPTADAIFRHWESLPPDQRDAYLDEATAGDPTLRAQVEAKIHFHFPPTPAPKPKPPCITTRFKVIVPPNAIAGIPFTFTVQAIGGNNLPCNTFNGTVDFTVNDTLGTYNVPSGTITAGIGTFTGTLFKKGFGKKITATSGSITGTSRGITVFANVANSFELFGYPNPATACNIGTVTARVLDAYGNKVPSYSGTTQFTSSDLFAVLPPQTRWKGTNSRNFQFTFKTTGNQSMTIYDVNAPSITGSLSITVNHGPATHFSIVFTPPVANASTGISYSITVTALDNCGNVDTGYTGTVQFSSTDVMAGLPTNYTYLIGDAGVKIFNITYNTTGSQIVVVQDIAHCEIIGTITKTVH
jgi:hypothetical protein